VEKFLRLGHRACALGLRDALNSASIKSKRPHLREKVAALAFARNLFTETELLDQRLVAGTISALEIREERATVIHHFEQTAAAVMILRVLFEVSLRELIDIGGEKRYLHFRGASVVFSAAVFLNDGGGLCGRESHDGVFLF
jgi:hypothetical protein